MVRAIVFVMIAVVCGIADASASSLSSSFIKNQIRIVYRAPGTQIRYTQRSMTAVPKKTLVWAADDADWLRRTFDSHRPYSVIQTSTIPAVRYINELFTNRTSTSLLCVFQREQEK